MKNRVSLCVVAVLAIFTSLIASSATLGAPASGKPTERPADSLPGALEAPASFVWTGLPSFAVVDTNFTATVTAKDAQGATLTSYSEPTTLETWITFAPFAVGATAGAAVTDRIYNTAFHDSRATMLYTASELGAAKWLGTLSLIPVTAGGQGMANFTVRVKPTTLTTLDGATWDAVGWQTAFTSASAGASPGNYHFTRPYYHDGVSNLLVDISFNNSTASTAGTVRSTTTATATVLSGTSNSLHGDPLTWAGATGPAPQYSTARPVLSAYVAKPIGQQAASPANFSGGTWTGPVSFPVFSVAPGGWMRAISPGGVAGFGNRVIISVTTFTGATDLMFADDFESGALGSAWSTEGGSGTPRVEVSSANTPRGSYHLQFDSNTPGSSFSRSQATITLNLANRTNVRLSNYVKGFAEESQTAPALQPFSSNTNFDGIAISADGANWYLARSYGVLGSAYGSNGTGISLDAIIKQFGLTYNSTFRIKFVQYDDQAIPNDGIAIDDIVVAANATTSVILEMPPTIPEGSSNIPATVRLPTVATAATTVTLTSYAPTRLVTPASVVVPAGSSTASVTVSTPDNPHFDGGKAVYVVASATTYGTGVTYTYLPDDEQGVLSMALPASVTEGGSNAIGTVSVTPMPLNSLVIALTSGNPAEATVPASVTIQAGATSANFAVTPVNDTRLDGTQTVGITASGAGVNIASASIAVLDNDVASLEWTPIVGAKVDGAPFPVTVTAKDIGGATQIFFNGTADLSAAVGTATRAITPLVTTAFVNGVWTGNVAVSGSGNGVTLTAQNGSLMGTSNGFFLASATLDSDHDGMDDAYEVVNGLDPLDDGTNAPRLGPLGDADYDGLRNLLEYGFNTAANIASAGGLPSVELLVNPADTERYPVVTYRRRISPGALQYFIEVSPTLDGWSEPAAAEIEPVGSAVPTGDGATETVQFRLKPALDASPVRRFVRVGVRLAVP